MEGNLTKGPILKTLTKLAVPIMASSFLGTLYNITDMAWIGLLGSKAVAGVGVGGMFTWLSQGLAAMARMGGQVHVAQCIGRGDRERAHGFAQAAVQLAAFMGMAYAILSLLFTRQMVGFFQLADAQAHAAAMSYTRIACGLIVFSFMTLTLTGLYTAQGDSKTPFIANLVGLVTNMVLDPVLILGAGMFPKLGVVGAAIATVTAQAIVMSIMIVGIVIQKKENVLKGIRLTAKIPKEYLGGLCRIGIPTAIQGMAYCAISMVLTRFVAVWGDAAVAVQRVGSQIESISWMTADGFAASINSFAGQNFGGKRYDRVQKGYFVAAACMFVWGTFCSFLLIFGAQPIFRLFIQETDVIPMGVQYLTVLGLSQMFMCIESMTVGALSGIGKTFLSSIISISLTSARVPLAFLLQRTPLGLNGVWWALSLTSVAKGIIFFIVYLKVLKNLTQRGETN